MPKRKRGTYRYTGDDGNDYPATTYAYLAEAAGLEPWPRTAQLRGGLNFKPRHVWCKEANPTTLGHTQRISLVVQADSPLYRTDHCLRLVVNDIEMVTTGRVGETLTFGQPQSLDLVPMVPASKEHV
jgi:hypothetical protein